jgi:hypothetical protein
VDSATARGGWAAAECIAHLTLTTDAYLPMLETARRSVSPGSRLPKKYPMGIGGRLLWWLLKPPARAGSRTRTLPAFIPEAAAPKADTMASFVASQDALLAWIESARELPMDAMVLTSPFNEKMRYNAYAALRVIAVHQARHLWQAERAARGIP